MSIYHDPRSPFWQFDFQWRGHRFYGSTKARTKREAEKVETAERERAKQVVAQMQATKTSLRLDDIAGRYWSEVGQHNVSRRNTWLRLSMLVELFGEDKLITDITHEDAQALVAWRRGHRTRGGALIAPATVNLLTAQLKTLFTRTKSRVRLEHEPEWRKLWLAVPQERVRELHDDEAERLKAATREDYWPVILFALMTGLRQNECLLRWSEVDWGTKQIRRTGKGGKTIIKNITDSVREILWPLRGHHPEYVFTYGAHRTYAGYVKGRRYPITLAGLRAYWHRLRKRAGITDFRFHDLRHDHATKLLRLTGNLKLVQRALNHSDIKATLRYAHVLNSDVAEAEERLAESRKNSQSVLRKVG